MPRDVTITFADGSTHVYRGVPDDATPASVQDRAGRDFPSLRPVNIDGGRGAIPGQEGEAARVAMLRAQPQPTAVDRVVGAGEAALTTVTSIPAGVVGIFAGLNQIGSDIARLFAGQQPTGVTPEQAFQQAAGAVTYQPRTESGQDAAQAVGEFVNRNVLPVAPMAGELGALARGTQAARESTAPLIGSAVDRVVSRMQAVPPEAPAPVAAAVAPVAAPVAAVARVAQPSANAGLEQVATTAKQAASGSKTAATDLAAAAAPDARTVQAAQRLGIEGYLQPDHVTTSQAYRELAQAVKSIPGSEARAAELQGLQAVGERAAKIIDDLGGADVSRVDQGVKQTGMQRIADLSNMEASLYGKVSDGLPPRTPAPADNALALVRQRAADLGGEANLSPMEKTILQRLSRAEDGSAPTYALLDDVRKDVGAVTARGGPFADADVGLAKRYYGLLAEDQLQAAEAAGQKWNYLAAQYATKLRKGIEDDLSSLFGRELDKSMAPALGTAVSSLAKGDAARLTAILEAVPKPMRQDVVAAGLNTAFRTAATNGPISFAQYAKWFEGLMRNRESYRVVMGNLTPEARQQLGDLYRVSRGVAAASRERITTGRIQAAQELFREPDTLASRLYDTARRSAAGAVVGTAVGSVAGPGVGGAVASALTKGAKPEAIRAVDKLIVSPEFQRLVQANSQAQRQAAVRAIAESAAFRKFMQRIGATASTVSEREAWIYQAMTPASQGVALQPRRDERAPITRNP